MTATVKRSVPLPTLVNMGNPLVRMLLGSPLHRVLDHAFAVLHLVGRKTGRRYNANCPPLRREHAEQR